MSCCDTQEQLAGFVECRQHFHLPFISTKCYYKKNIYMWLRLSAIGKGSHLLLNLNLSFLCTMWLYIAISSLSLLSYYILGMYLPFPLISCVTSSTVVYIYTRVYSCIGACRSLESSFRLIWVPRTHPVCQERHQSQSQGLYYVGRLVILHLLLEF